MNTVSASDMYKRAQALVASRLTGYDKDLLEPAGQRLVAELRRQATDCRLDIRDYEYADTAYERANHAKAAKERLNRLRELVLAASELGVFGAADVAQLSSSLDTVADKLQD